ncbi:MAG: 5-oxoprolinase subunit PxpA [Chloroflexi bacterium]|uniref:5-oxoprolinase subunit A n=1 Tax=Candidatus Chlorohelix allophototropha TaxID=3003348 RepID=A0A8T7LUW9_9CHLR|nr:5-oxoprolinase subunit PxpA [Chloroflexota bacterium]WJW67679.1 5-oxoprolinase subunit PxpA [Chloroflexota bacterium L227-S17]
MQIDINCDMGESFGHYKLGNDLALLEYVTSANVACGFHAGDPLVMSETVKLALDKDVAVGAHPSYPDLQGFGRRKMEMTAAEIEAFILYQIGALSAFVHAQGATLTHVKAHGALYNVAALEMPVAEAIARAIARFDQTLIMVVLATSPLMIEAGQRAGLQVAREAFADRAYNADGTLVNRKLPNSLITDPVKATEQVVRLVKKGEIMASDGSILELQADTVCIHGDGPTALEIARHLSETLAAENIKTCALQKQGRN